MSGAATTYVQEMWGGRPLFCSTPQRPLYYDAASPPWAAFSLSDYQSGAVRCWDLMHIREYLPDGTVRSSVVYALDAGPFGANCVMMGDECVPIVVDRPGEVAVCNRVEVINLSAVSRAYRDALRTDPDAIPPRGVRISSERGTGD